MEFSTRMDTCHERNVVIADCSRKCLVACGFSTWITTWKKTAAVDATIPDLKDSSRLKILKALKPKSQDNS